MLAPALLLLIAVLFLGLCLLRNTTARFFGVLGFLTFGSVAVLLALVGVYAVAWNPVWHFA